MMKMVPKSLQTFSNKTNTICDSLYPSCAIAHHYSPADCGLLSTFDVWSMCEIMKLIFISKAKQNVLEPSPIPTTVIKSFPFLHVIVNLSLKKGIFHDTENVRLCHLY